MGYFTRGGYVTDAGDYITEADVIDWEGRCNGTGMVSVGGCNCTWGAAGMSCSGDCGYEPCEGCEACEADEFGIVEMPEYVADPQRFVPEYLMADNA